jgi:LmbE family N-acetylglucosaminyl deacetylase
MVIVAIGAHPDDVEFGCFGTLAKYKDEHKIVIIIFTSGELLATKEIRQQEAIKSAELINAKILFLDFPDGSIPINSDSVSKLKEIIDDLNPDQVYTLFPQDTHQDHRAVSEITLSACKFVPKIYFYEVPQTDKKFSPTFFVNITEFFQRKTEALECFLSQNNKPYLNIQQIKGLAEYRAYNIYRPNQLFEAFSVYRDVDG